MKVYVCKSYSTLDLELCCLFTHLGIVTVESIVICEIYAKNISIIRITE